MNTQHPTQGTSNCHDAEAPYVGAKPAFVAPTSFQHITLTTGHSCSQPRELVAIDVATMLSHMIAEGLANGGWTSLKRFGEAAPLHVSVSGPTLSAKLYLPCKDPRATKPAVRIGISALASSGADIWKQLRSHAVCIGSGVPFNPPRQPWIGAVLDISPVLAADSLEKVVGYAAMMEWAGDFERCLAWGFVAWLESESRPK